jgi:hypothetical protein
MFLSLAGEFLLTQPIPQDKDNHAIKILDIMQEKFKEPPGLFILETGNN